MYIKYYVYKVLYNSYTSLLTHNSNIAAETVQEIYMLIYVKENRTIFIYLHKNM